MYIYEEKNELPTCTKNALDTTLSGWFVNVKVGILFLMGLWTAMVETDILESTVLNPDSGMVTPLELFSLPLKQVLYSKRSITFAVNVECVGTVQC